jgi:iron complex transport system substrate-binding protein
MTTIKSRVDAVPPNQRPKVYYARGPRGLETGLGGSINVETIEFLERNVAAERPGGLATVSIEQVLLWDPEVIITIDREFASAVQGDPAWRPSRPCAMAAFTWRRNCRSGGSISRHRSID